MGDDGLGFDEDFMATMLGDFLDESHDYLELLHDELGRLEVEARDLSEGEAIAVDLDLLNEMFRAAHSLKGLSAMLQLDDVNQLTHRIENVFEAARSDQLSLTSNVVEVTVDAVDRLGHLIDRLRSPDAAEVDYETTMQQIEAILGSEGISDSAPATPEAAAAIPPPAEASVSQPASVADETTAPIADPFVGVADESDVPVKYLPIFIAESEESLDAVGEMLLGDCKELKVDDLLVICHRIKGAAASVGLHRPAKLAHFMEDLLQEMRDDGLTATQEIADSLLDGVDALKEYVLALKQGEPISGEFYPPYCKLITARTGLFQPPSAPTSEATTPAELETPVAVDAVPVEDSVAEAGGPAETVAAEEFQGLDEAVRRAATAAAPVEAPPGATCWIGQVVFEADLPLAELKARLAYERLAAGGEVFYCDPPESQIDESAGLRRLVFGVACSADEPTLRRRLGLEGVQNCDLETLPRVAASDPVDVPSAPPAVAPPMPAQPAEEAAEKSDEAGRSRTKPTETLRVDIDRLDQLMNLAGQLVINKARFGQIGDRLRGLATQKQATHAVDSAAGAIDRLLEQSQEESPSSAAFAQNVRSRLQNVQGELTIIRRDVEHFGEIRSLVNELSEAVHQLDRVSDGIQKSVMDTRMVPIGPLFGRFRRVVRDITRINRKDVRLVIRGENTELDKRMIDELSDPLIHMVRNAADHGVESPDDREAAGKSRYGTVTLDAFHRGNRICIQVSDDGRGLDPEKIRSKAIDKEILSEAEAERLTPHQCFQLIWEPGLSTAEQVTEVSGRGMGMDIVRSKIEQLNGAVELDSRPGVGTTITIKLPLTLAILPSLLTTIDDAVFAVPVESVSEIVRVDRQEFSTVHGRRTARVRGRVVSVATLDELLVSEIGAPTEAPCDRTLVIVSSDDQELGLVVDDLLGEQDIVIKSLAENYRHVDGVAGASILGDGRVSLILDVGALIQRAGRFASATETEDVLQGTASHA